MKKGLAHLCWWLRWKAVCWRLYWSGGCRSWFLECGWWSYAGM